MTDEWVSLCGRISSMKSVAVSFSGGVDSTVVLAAAAEALPCHHIAVFADVPMLSERQRRIAHEILDSLGTDSVTVKLGWDDMPGVRDNNADRCYRCKKAIYSAVRNVAGENGYRVCADGENFSDRTEDRPGRRAAAEYEIVSPLRDLGIRRDAVRKMCDALPLNVRIVKETCMATRLPLGTPFGNSEIHMIEECEDLIRSVSGVRQIRMRVRDGSAALLASPSETELLIRKEKELASLLAEKGIGNIAIDPDGYREE